MNTRCISDRRVFLNVRLPKCDTNGALVTEEDVLVLRKHELKVFRSEVFGCLQMLTGSTTKYIYVCVRYNYYIIISSHT